MLCYEVKIDQLSDTRPHLHSTEETARIMLISSILISHERTDLKYETSVPNYSGKEESEKCFWNNLLLHHQSNIIAVIIDVVVLLMKKQKHINLNNCHRIDVQLIKK